MADNTIRYKAELKRQMVELLRTTGRSAASLSREFGPSAVSILLWAKEQEARDRVTNAGELTRKEREELVRLRRENRQLKEEREILSRFAPEGFPWKRSSGS